MKRISAGKHLPAVTICWGILSLVLRWQLYRTAVDAKNLLVRNHPLSIALLVLTVGAMLHILMAIRKTDAQCGDDLQGKANLPAAAGNVAAGAGILATVLTVSPGMGGYLARAWQILGLAAPACFLLAGMARALGKNPFFLLHVVPCLFFLVHIVTRYQLWSSNPQMQDYVFALRGAVALMLFAFYTAAMEAACGNFRMRLGTGLAAIYLCAGELAKSSCPALYLGGILWVLTELCGIRYVSEEKK